MRSRTRKYVLLVAAFVAIFCWQLLLVDYSSHLAANVTEVSPESDHVTMVDVYFIVIVALLLATVFSGYVLARLSMRKYSRIFYWRGFWGSRCVQQ